eukprot:TRINITY_DN9428_c0_g1_i1.p1 TRINITY_DN9428_c0_g1~~TRINITY_DN9428_c0_g1_i1.p1  ORF type:complete len:561 (+),score=148.91 TRINITY_DN9428_c0_g1_i1:304-1986(+)
MDQENDLYSAVRYEELGGEVKEQSFVSPQRLPAWKSSVLFEPRHPIYRAHEELEVGPDEGIEMCPEKKMLKFINYGEPGGRGVTDCNRCFERDIATKKGGYGYCPDCCYAICHLCMKNKPTTGPMCHPPPQEPQPEVSVSETGLEYARLPDQKQGRIFALSASQYGAGELLRIPKQIHAPAIENGLLLPRQTDDPPPCTATAVKMLGFKNAPRPMIAKAVDAKALLGGEPNASGAPLGRKWVIRGDDIVERGVFVTPVPRNAIVTWKHNGVLRTGRVREWYSDDTYKVQVHAEDRPQRLSRLTSTVTEQIQRVPAVELTQITFDDAQRITDQQRKLEGELSEVSSRCLSLIDACTHADKPYVKREKGVPKRGYYCKYVQCNWCGKVLVVNSQYLKQDKAVYERVVFDDRGEGMLVHDDEFKEFRQSVNPSLHQGIKRPDGRGWTRKVVLLLPEIQQLHRRGYIHTADFRQLSAYRSHAKDLSNFERTWADDGLIKSWHTPTFDTQTLYGPSYLVPGSRPLSDVSGMIRMRKYLHKQDEKRRILREGLTAAHTCIDDAQEG